MNIEGKNIQVLALDLDGTIVTHEYTMSKRTIEAVGAFRKAGVKILIASGRAARSAFPWAVRLGGVSGMISHNGAAAYVSGTEHLIGGAVAEPPYRMASSSPLPEELCRQIVEISRTLPYQFHAYAGDDWLCERQGPGYENYLARAGFDAVFTNFDQAGTLGFFKAMFVHTPGIEMDRLAERMREELGGKAEVMFTSPGYLEIVRAGVSKATGLSLWLSVLGLSMDSVLAFGDAENDEAMLLAAGMGIAMGNAPESLKKKVGRFTGTIGEDGVALALEKFLKET